LKLSSSPPHLVTSCRNFLNIKQVPIQTIGTQIRSPPSVTMIIPITSSKSTPPAPYALIELNGKIYMPSPLTTLAGETSSTIKESNLVKIVSPQNDRVITSPSSTPVKSKRNSSKTSNEDVSSLSNSSTLVSQTELGKLTFSSDGKGTPLLTVGSHELSGSRENLKSKLAVFQKVVDNKKKRKRSNNGGEGEDVGNVEYVVAGFVEEKFIFKTYPKLLMKR